MTDFSRPARLQVYPYDPRLTPSPIPSAAPTEGPFLYMCVNAQWVGHIVGMLDRLTWDDAWQGTEEQIRQAVSDSERVIALFSETPCYDVPEPGEESDCVEYPISSPWISFAPNDPFQTPNFVPPGYNLPPWYNNPGIPLPGVLPGDAMVNFAAFPILADIGEILSAGLPRFSIPVVGQGELEIEFVNIPQGGYVMVNIDNDPLQTQLLDLNALSITDIASLESILTLFGLVGEDLGIEPSQTHEVKIDTPGNHVIYVTFLPNVGSDVLFGFGGGVRRISLCGFDSVGEVPVPQIQITDCILQWRPHGATPWVDLGNVCGPPGADGQDGADSTVPGPVGPPGADSTVPGPPGADGREIELTVLGGISLVWRYVGDLGWNLLYNIPQPGEGESCANACDYAYSLIRNVEAVILKLIAHSIVLFPGGYTIVNRNDFRGNEYTKLMFAEHFTLLTDYTQITNLLFQLRHGIDDNVNNYPVQPEWSLAEMGDWFEVVRVEVVNVIACLMDDCGRLEITAQGALNDWLDLSRQDTERPIEERRALDFLYTLTSRITFQDLSELAQGRLWSAPESYCLDCGEEPPPPVPTCEDTDWSYYTTFAEGVHGWTINDGAQAADAINSVFDSTDAFCPGGRADLTVTSDVQPSTIIDRIELTFDVVKGEGLPGVSVNLLDGFTNVVSETVGETVLGGVLVWSGTRSWNNVIIRMQHCRPNEESITAVFSITSILICGTGTPPLIGLG